ncbi:MAG: bacillithiol biosynthesis BshC, partial [Bacteroidota bacterium]
TSFARLQAVSDELSEPFHAQIYPSRLNLFLLTEDGRFALDPEADGRVRLKGTEQTHTLGELRQLLADSPEMFSANVALRPIAQDVLLPTAAYVAGPGEIAYFAQLKPLYEWAGVPMPIVYPRASVSLVEGKVQKVMDRYGIDLPALAGDPNVLFKRLVMDQMDVDLDAAFNEIGAKLHQAVNEIKPIAAGVDSTLSKSAESVRASFMKEWNGFKGRVLKAEKRNNDVIEGQLDKARVNLLPAGKLQERVVSPLYFLNKYGLDLPTRCLNGFDLDTSRHQVFEV